MAQLYKTIKEKAVIMIQLTKPKQKAPWCLEQVLELLLQGIFLKPCVIIG